MVAVNTHSVRYNSETSVNLFYVFFIFTVIIRRVGFGNISMCFFTYLKNSELLPFHLKGSILWLLSGMFELLASLLLVLGANIE